MLPVVTRPNRLQRLLLITAFLTHVATAGAATADWPSSSAPCNGSLQACIDGTPLPATIRISSTAPILTGTILLSNQQSLIAGPNARPRLQNGVIQIGLGVPGSGHSQVTVDNLILENTQIHVSIGTNVNSDSQRLTLSQLKIENTTVSPAILIAPSDDASTKAVSIRGSSIKAPQILRVSTGFQAKNLTVDLDNSLLRPQASAQAAVMWTTLKANSMLRLRRNRFEGQTGTPGKAIEVGTPDLPVESALASVWLERNVFVGMRQPIQVNDNAGHLQVEIRNNSLTRFDTGIGLLRGGPGVLTLNVANNLITQGIQAIGIVPSASSVPELTRSRNLYDAVGTPSIGLEANAVLGNPLTRSSSNLRLTGYGPALDSADPAQLPQTTITDFDRVVGTRGNGPDIGAFEWTDTVSFAQQSSSAMISSNTWRLPTTIISPAREQIGFAQRLVSGDAAPLPANASKHLGLYLTGSEYRLFNQDGSPFPIASFRLLRTRIGSYSRDHVLIQRAISQVGNPANNVTGNQTIIPASTFPASLGIADRLIPIILQRWDPPFSAGTFNNHAVGIARMGSGFSVFNQDLAAMPHDAGFHVLMPAASAGYTLRIGSTQSSSALALSHDLLIDNECAHVYVTAAYGDPLNPGTGSAHVPAAIVARFDHRPDGGGQWLAARGDGLNFAPGTVLHAYIDPEVANQCREASF